MTIGIEDKDGNERPLTKEDLPKYGVELACGLKGHKYVNAWAEKWLEMSQHVRFDPNINVREVLNFLLESVKPYEIGKEE